MDIESDAVVSGKTIIDLNNYCVLFKLSLPTETIPICLGQTIKL